ncbi:aspartate carbamoyltransferase regulatory subunit [Candidatus Woesearchaeota archaeon]|nr:aspartate carbamoyltransferase regulatory subunit [Candidatus Woesearchaeota archaeon]
MKKELSISAIKEGSVIDHIPSNVTLKVVDILDLKGIRGIISIATNLSSKAMGKKGIIKISGKDLTKEEVDKIALIAPHATVNIISKYDVKQKIKVAIPSTINRIIKCSNPNCITNNEKVATKFYVLSKDPLKVVCHYCERNMEKEDISLL